MSDQGTPLRYRFADFVLSPRRRELTRAGRLVPLIPKYFDVLVLLVERRAEAVPKSAIFDAVWRDVVVSDGALTQAVRTLRRTLGDDRKEPRFIRTVSRHGYQFVWAEVLEEREDGATATAALPAASAPETTSLDGLVDALLAAVANGEAGEDDARDLAEQLHHRGTDVAVAALTARAGHARALALLRDARWSSPVAGGVPILGDSESTAAAWHTVRLRLDDQRQALVQRWAGATIAGTVGGAAAGVVGGLLLLVAPASGATGQAPVALAVVGALAGAAGAAGIGAGLAFAEAVARSARGLALVGCAAVAGAGTGALAHALSLALLATVFGLTDVGAGGALEGGAVGAGIGLAYAVATRHTPGGALAAPGGGRRVGVAAQVGLACAVVGVVISWFDGTLVGGLVHDIARASATAAPGLAPLGRLVGEPDFTPWTRAILAAFEAAVLGSATVFGLTSRPRA